MSHRTWLWRLTGTLSVLSSLLLMAAFVVAVLEIVQPYQGEGPAHEPMRQAAPDIANNPYHITVIGDSIAKGTGDDTGGGIGKRLSALLQQKGLNSQVVNNLGINGLTTGELLTELNNEGVQYSLKKAGIILLSIGGNDLFGSLPSGQSMELPTAAELEQVSQTAGEQFADIVDQLHRINPKATLVYVSLYNPFSDLQDVREAGNDIIADWNQLTMKAMNDHAGNRSLIVPTFDLFMNNSERYLANDHFHPNGDGYQQMAERIIQAISLSHQ